MSIKAEFLSSVKIEKSLYNGDMLARSSKGFSLIELLIVAAIILLLITTGLGVYLRQLEKGRDGQRKRDLNRIKVAFTNYYDDEGCFPPADILNDCGGNGLEPYLDRIPCDPKNNQPYYYDVDSDCSNYFRVLTTLEVTDDPEIKRINCDGSQGCGGAGLAAYNYGVADGGPLSLAPVSEDADGDAGSEPGEPTPAPVSPTPTPTSPPGATNTPTPTRTPTPTLSNPLTPTPTVFQAESGALYCCNNQIKECEQWDLISPCAGTYSSLESCVAAPNNCSR